MRSRRTTLLLCAALAAALLIVSAQIASANCAELKIFGSRVTKMVMTELGPQFERASGYTPVVVADVAAVMKRRIETGEPFDLAVLVDFQADELIRARR
jgi:molybdate transport system substrate-binding protein